ncbi:MAG: DUF3084 domain-containing protein [Synechococcus sp. BS301-5m-G54]|uniref:DUF3084 domain-containing protein n=1 Tax=Synechococcales TaxID=1890424 RepID=UPI0004E05394|nr:DUF3084 domain-containing protein [Synechococcus sp. KORDI-49]MBL6739180.1 DUF3084 domain-containing protein [Synechococcus sp. BS301-5m-G54]MBL6795329.1 DUF3084 domain-containing protein [Synechococcus sp. BS307-5m-G34]RCL54685.1 MAG: DUF3084 domain-containing protein [Synechococcus sp. MED-G70]HCX53825.1 DUF3084 domain-containing protein [Synechococcus sp. UBA9887]AII46830.1 hypothetical protein KR49_10315 [Synechococcus sp. KORDI-49]
MSGWLLIIALLVLGGVLSALGDRLGSRVGKARLSLFNMRPRRTAVLITVLTGSLISALSLGLMLLVSRQLRVGLFELDGLQQKLQDSRRQLQQNRGALESAEEERRQAIAQTQRIDAELSTAKQRAATLREELEPLQQQRVRLEAEQQRLSRDIQQRDRDIKARDADIRRTEEELKRVRASIQAGEAELKELERNLIALRRGSVVLSSGEALATATIRLESAGQAKTVIDRLLQDANLTAYQQVRPGETPDRQILLVPRNDVQRLRTIISKPGTWVVSIRSATNVLRGETIVYAFPDVRPNRRISRSGEVLASATLPDQDRSPEMVRRRLNLLLASAFAEVQRRGSLVEGLQFDGTVFAQLGLALVDRPEGEGDLTLEVIAESDSDSGDPVLVAFRVSP